MPTGIETQPWWPTLVDLKDELSLSELGERFGVAASTVSAALKRNGIDRNPVPPGPRSLRREEALPPEPGEKPSSPKQKEGRRRPRNKAHLVEAHEHLLGVLPDVDIAKMAGVHPKTVANFRSRAGIPAYRAGKGEEGSTSSSTETKPTKRPSKVEPFAALLGKVPDQVVADKAGVSRSAVQHYRTQCGVEAYTHSEEAAVAAAPTTRRSEALQPPQRHARTGLTAWKVTFASEQEAGVVVAADVTSAAVKAQTLGKVFALDLVGPLV